MQIYFILKKTSLIWNCRKWGKKGIKKMKRNAVSNPMRTLRMKNIIKVRKKESRTQLSTRKNFTSRRIIKLTKDRTFRRFSMNIWNNLRSVLSNQMLINRKYLSSWNETQATTLFSAISRPLINKLWESRRDEFKRKQRIFRNRSGTRRIKNWLILRCGMQLNRSIPICIMTLPIMSTGKGNTQDKKKKTKRSRLTSLTTTAITITIMNRICAFNHYTRTPKSL